MAADTSSPAAVTTPVVDAVAAAWASLSDEPILATSVAATESVLGAVITYDKTVSWANYIPIVSRKLKLSCLGAAIARLI
jgi:hypothetical protein